MGLVIRVGAEHVEEENNPRKLIDKGMCRATDPIRNVGQAVVA